jgi:septal ring factor EnvC (AmiA/AmiB activator)
MMGRRVREWPRLVAAVSVAAVLLVLIGVVVASASSGGTKTVTAKPAAAVSTAPKPASGASKADKADKADRADKQQIASLQAQLKHQSTELTATRHALGASQAKASCWRTKARHPKKERALHCAKTP